jgi:hypothetical protein
MRLTSALIERTLSQFEAEAIPDSHPALSELNRLFGDHTFFLDSNGLNIVEPAQSPETRVQAGKVVNLANWNDADPPSLTLHEPESTDVVILLGSKH